MPKIPHDPVEDSLGTALSRAVEAVVPAAVVAPMFIAGVSRKLNTGNFENVDILAAISLPMPHAVGANAEELAAIVNDVAAQAFGLVSGEVGQRYEMLKALQKAKHGRPETP